MNWKTLYNPLAVLGKRSGLIVAMLVVIVLTAVAYWGGVHLDGALDLHINPVRPSLAMVAIESLSAWLCLGLLLFAASKVFGGNGGVTGHLASAGLARFPYIISAVISSRQFLGGAMLAVVDVRGKEIVVHPEQMMTPAVIAGLLAVVALTIWSVAMLYCGYRETARTEGAKTVVSFIIGLVVAEIVSKIIVMLAFNAGI